MALMEINWKPDRENLRKFGFYTGAFIAILGAVVFWRGRLLAWEYADDVARTVGLTLWGIGSASCATVTTTRAGPAPAIRGARYSAPTAA